MPNRDTSLAINKLYISIPNDGDKSPVSRSRISGLLSPSNQYGVTLETEEYFYSSD